MRYAISLMVLLAAGAAMAAEAWQPGEFQVTFDNGVMGAAYQHGQFAMTLQPDNCWLPDSIQWTPKGVEVLAPKTGVNLSFTSFEFRNKFYREENRLIWEKQKDPRFVADAEFRALRPLRREGYAGVEVEYESSFAKVTRRIGFSDTDARFFVEYVIEPTRDIVVHETPMFSMGFCFAPGLTEKSVLDVRAEKPTLLTTTGLKGVSWQASFLNDGPTVATDPEKRVSLVMVGSHGGAAPAEAPVKLLAIAKDKTFTLRADFTLAPADQAAATALRAAADVTADDKAFVAFADAHVVFAQAMQQKDEAARAKLLKEAEDLCLLAGRLNPDYAEPYGFLAAIRRDAKLPGQTEAWLEAGYRMPYNYGYMLSGSAGPRGMDDLQQRTHAFNVLIAVENTLFYPDYYIWAARPFERMHMYSQECAMYRQALWAVDYMPRTEATREKVREGFRKKIAELEKKILNATCTDLPPLIPVRVEKTAREQAIEKALKRRVDVSFVDTPLRNVVDYLNHLIDPKSPCLVIDISAVYAAAQERLITFKLKDVPVSAVLDMVLRLATTPEERAARNQLGYVVTPYVVFISNEKNLH